MEEVIYFQNKGDVMIVGDFNAKTGSLDDTIPPDKSDELFDLVLDEPPPKRNSQDDAVNPRGNDLLDMCRSLDLNIVNGRKTGDLFGKYTCFQWNGNSLVDYLITSSSVFKKIYFRGGRISSMVIRSLSSLFYNGSLQSRTFRHPG